MSKGEQGVVGKRDVAELISHYFNLFKDKIRIMHKFVAIP